MRAVWMMYMQLAIAIAEGREVQRVKMLGTTAEC